MKLILQFNYKIFKPKFIFKKDFDRFKDKDGYIKMIWSFGNNGQGYLYSSEIEPYKHACHQAIVFKEWVHLQRLCPEVWEDAFNAIKHIHDIKQRRLLFGPAIVKKLKNRFYIELKQYYIKE